MVDKRNAQQQDSFVAFIASLEDDLAVHQNGIIKDMSRHLSKSSIEFVLDRIQTEYGASSPYIHSPAPNRRKNVLKIYNETDWSVSRIAAHFNMSERQVYNIVR